MSNELKIGKLSISVFTGNNFTELENEDTALFGAVIVMLEKAVGFCIVWRDK